MGVPILEYVVKTPAYLFAKQVSINKKIKPLSVSSFTNASWPHISHNCNECPIAFHSAISLEYQKQFSHTPLSVKKLEALPIPKSPGRGIGFFSKSAFLTRLAPQSPVPKLVVFACVTFQYFVFWPKGFGQSLHPAARPRPTIFLNYQLNLKYVKRFVLFQ
ncbi:MAG: hypothetical protein HC913_21665 [Microscillaceae bacterium]|nr:hypothetical protein [Microscillaceae bacterium]